MVLGKSLLYWLRGDLAGAALEGRIKWRVWVEDTGEGDRVVLRWGFGERTVWLVGTVSQVGKEGVAELAVREVNKLSFVNVKSEARRGKCGHQQQSHGDVQRLHW